MIVGRARRRHRGGQPFPPAVGDLDPQNAATAVKDWGESHREQEVPPGEPAMSDRVRGEFTHHQSGGVQLLTAPVLPPVDQLLSREQSGETRSAPGRAELLTEGRGRGQTADQRSPVTDFVLHVTERGRRVVR